MKYRAISDRGLYAPWPWILRAEKARTQPSDGNGTIETILKSLSARCYPAMNRHIHSWSLVLLFWASLAFAGDCSYRNPVLLGDFPDPTVIRVGPDYYATATEPGWA